MAVKTTQPHRTRKIYISLIDSASPHANPLTSVNRPIKSAISARGRCSLIVISNSTAKETLSR
jgi:hypothetical protein